MKININLVGLDNYFVNESFKTLRTNLQFCGSSNKVISITSCDANEGKTTTALLLAKTLSEIKKKVVFVDCDLRKSVVARRYSDVRVVNGLSEYLLGQVSKQDIIYNTQFDGLDVVFSGPCCNNSVELIMSDEFTTFIEQLREEYDYVIIDTPPLGLVIDSAVVAKNCDGAIMVISSGKVRYRQARNTKIQLEKSGCKILGVVLNHVEKRGERYYKRYYQKYYGKGYYTHYMSNDGGY